MSKLMEDKINNLNKSASVNEIKVTVKVSQFYLKIPSPDGFTCVCYQKFKKQLIFISES
jgi:hypothetical protein